MTAGVMDDEGNNDIIYMVLFTIKKEVDIEKQTNSQTIMQTLAYNNNSNNDNVYNNNTNSIIYSKFTLWCN